MTTTTTTTALPAWTVRQARYDTAATVRGTTEHGGIDVDYVPCRHGVVARAWVAPGMTEVVLRRRGHKYGTFQGTIESSPNGWRILDIEGRQLGEVTGDYLDAEARLLRLRTGRRTQVRYQWPSWLLRAQFGDDWAGGAR